MTTIENDKLLILMQEGIHAAMPTGPELEAMRKACQIWQGAMAGGYGHKQQDGRDVRTHRLKFAEHHGLELAALDGLIVRHKCGNPACMNPAHLVLGDQQDNLRDAVAQGAPCGRHKGINRAAVLADVQAGMTRRAAGRKHGCAYETVNKIVWKAREMAAIASESISNYARAKAAISARRGR